MAVVGFHKRRRVFFGKQRITSQQNIKHSRKLPTWLMFHFTRETLLLIVTYIYGSQKRPTKARCFTYLVVYLWHVFENEGFCFQVSPILYFLLLCTLSLGNTYIMYQYARLPLNDSSTVVYIAKSSLAVSGVHNCFSVCFSIYLPEVSEVVGKYR